MTEQEQKVKETLVRVLGQDVPGNKNLLAGLTMIKGISWAYSNAICLALKLDKNKRMADLSKEEIKKIEDSVGVLEVPSFLKNRQKDFDEGADKHLIGSDLSLRIEFDIKRLRKIKSYRGIRHSAGLPVRGQRTKSNFRKNRRKVGAVGVKKKKR
ncbi:30S ribosomal protein S13 [Candidatus Pacearchaeota archaeon]|nr:MAG: 30S ribosomal protein S13 [Candidatus Pacearchaeota archaeon]